MKLKSSLLLASLAALVALLVLSGCVAAPPTAPFVERQQAAVDAATEAITESQSPQPSVPPVETPPVPTAPSAPAAPLASQPAPTGAEKVVEISANGFSPATVEVNAGDTVTWVNKDAVAHRPASAQHPTHLVYPGSGADKCGAAEAATSNFDSCKSLAPGEIFAFTFDKIGEWKYHDHLNCCTDSRFFGTMVVKAPTAAESVPKEEAAKPAVSVVLKSLPRVAAAGKEFPVSWSIAGEPGMTSHTAVHYGRQSVSNPKSPADYAFTSRIFCTAAPCKFPGSFQVPLAISEEGIYYYRAHAIISGTHVWSDEAFVNVSAAPEVVATPSYGGGGGY